LIPSEKKSPPRLPPSLLVAAGGALGTLARHTLDTALPVQAAAFPWTTFFINTAGSLVLGLVLAISETRPSAPAWVRTFLAIGFCGAFTTFSTVSLEFVQLAENSATGIASLYILASIAAGTAAAAFGSRLGTARP
jgi:CrcB protein